MLEYALGSVRIHRIVESEEPNFDPLAFFPETASEDWKPYAGWLRPHPKSPGLGYITLTLQSYLLRTRHHNILVDTCIGDHKSRQGSYTPASWHQTSGGVLLTKLAAAGYRREDIDYVMCTHLHSDHVGWNTQLANGRWVPTFPNAKYIMSARELSHWQAIHRQTPMVHFDDSILPVLQARQELLVANDYALDDEVSLESTPGHTPDHFSVRVASAGATAVITGDLMHSPVQVTEHQWAPRFDLDAAMAAQTRLSFLQRHCEASTLVCGTHFPSPSFGRIVACSESFKFVCAD
jgi:glyoxylase-like metal-dependent hydrolase (beta-lactamase superfamily II)